MAPLRRPPRALVCGLLAMAMSACAAAPPRTTPHVAVARPQALPPPPPELAALLERIPKVATDTGAEPEEQTLAKDIQAFGATAVPHVLPLLESSDPRVRRFAGSVASDLAGLTERDLDALVAARKRGVPGIPPAIGRIGTPRAIQFLIDELSVRSASTEQVIYALKLAGSPAAMQLARVFDSPALVGHALAMGSCGVFRSMGSDAAPAVDILVAGANRAESFTENRLFAIYELGCMGRTARAAIPALKALAAKEPATFGAAVQSALLATGSTEVLPALVEALRAHPDDRLLFEIATLGTNAREAGPVVAALLAGSTREVRIAAARTLGIIGYDGDPAPLISLLRDDDDWQTVYAASESLGRLRAGSALSALEGVAKTHWYPPVREVAHHAVRAVRGIESSPTLTYDESFTDAFFFPYARVRAAIPPSPRPMFAHAPNELAPQELNALTYELKYDDDGTTRTVKQRPVVGLKTPDGYLVGSSRGEFGGELMYSDGKSPPTRVMEENVMGIYPLGARVVVVAGLAHMGMNDGALYLVKPASPGHYEVTRWKTLPGAPHAPGLLRDGSLFVSCEGGDVVVKRDGTMAMANGAP